VTFSDMQCYDTGCFTRMCSGSVYVMDYSIIVTGFV